MPGRSKESLCSLRIPVVQELHRQVIREEKYGYSYSVGIR